MTINVNVRSANEPEYSGNISISHQAGVRHKGHISSDDIQESSSNYQEDRVPAADYPELAETIENFSNAPLPGKRTTPGGKFSNHLKNEVLKLTPEQFKQIQQGNPNIKTPEQAQKFLLFAWSHPGAVKDPQVNKMLEEMVNEAKQQTAKELKLPPNWTPEPQPSESDSQMAETQDNKFLELANQMAETPAETNQLTAAYYHPELAQTLDPDLQALLAQCESAAASETSEEFGLPQGYSPPKDAEGFDLKMSANLSEIFSQIVEELPNSDLTENQKAQLKTLLADPKAKVPDRNKLLSTFKQLQNQAKQALFQKFNLPANYNVISNKQIHQAQSSAKFLAEFEEKVNSQTSPPLTSAQKQLLLATGGTNGENLPPELKAIFNQLKNETLNDILDNLGLPKDWQPKVKTGDLKIKKVEQKEGGSKTEETGEAEEGSAAEGVQGFSMGGMRKVNTSNDAVNLDTMFEPHAVDGDLQKKVINHYNEYLDNFTKFSNSYLNLNESMHMGDEILVVHLALDALRSSIYTIQSAESQLAVKNALMQKEVQELKILKQKEELADAQKQMDSHPKECFIFKIIDVICPVPVLHDIVEDITKIFFFAVDLLLGGLLNTIFQAAGSEPPGEDPLEMMGAINAQQAAELDGALTIVVAVIMIVVEIVISALIMQPELIALETVQITAEVAADTAEMAVDIAMVAARTAVEEALEQTGEKVAEKMVQEVVQQAVEKAVNEAADQIGNQAVRQGMKDAAEDFAKDVAKTETKKLLQQMAKEQGKEYDELVDVGAESSEGIVSDVTDAAKTAIEQGQQILQKMKRLVRLAKEEDDEVNKAFIKAAKKGAARNTIQGKIVGKLDFMMEVQSVLQDVCQSAQGFIEYAMTSKQANLDLEIAELQSEIDNLDATLQVLQKAMTLLQNSLTDCASWIKDVNAQESQLYQQMQIHYIAA
jgi:hypothetical protein